MLLNIVYNEYSADEKKDIVKLLLANKLPVADIEHSSIQFIVARLEGELVGCIGLEHYGKHVLLRSFAVRKEYQGQAVGQNLLNEFICKCANLDVKTIHLLTTTAQGFFGNRKFVVTDRKDAPGVIQRTTEFSHLCPSSSIYMTYSI